MNRSFSMVIADVLLVTIVLASAPLAPRSSAQDEHAAPAAEGEKPPSDDAAPESDEMLQLRAAKEHMERLKLRSLDEAGGVVDHIDRPLLAYGEPARANSHGTLWAFGRSGRPVAFLELWQGEAKLPFWFQSTIRTGDRHVLMESPNRRQWRPPEGAIARTAVDDAPRPAEERPARLRQIKSLARRFTAHEIWDPDNSRFELRLLVQPVHRYDDAPYAIQDGAVFIFAHGTNPEIILLMEALGTSVEESRWRYSVFPTSSAELHLEFDGREVWVRPRAPGVTGQPTDDYWLNSVPVETPPADDSADDGQ